MYFFSSPLLLLGKTVKYHFLGEGGQSEKFKINVSLCFMETFLICKDVIVFVATCKNQEKHPLSFKKLLLFSCKLVQK